MAQAVGAAQHGAGGEDAGRGLVAVALVVDAVAVLAFATAGRRSHARGVDVAGVLGTAWPYLAALLLGWVLARAWRRPAALSVGVVVWAVAVVAGTALRAASGSGTAWPFVVVTVAVLGALLLGWRTAWWLRRHRRGEDRRQRGRSGGRPSSDRTRQDAGPHEGAGVR